MSDLAKDVTSSSVLCLRIALTDIPILVDCKATTKCPSMLSQTIQYINHICFFFRLFFSNSRFKNFNYLHSCESTHIFRSHTGLTNASSLRSTTWYCAIKANGVLKWNQSLREKWGWDVESTWTGICIRSSTEIPQSTAYNS